MRIKLAKTVVKLVIESTTVPSSATLPPTSFVVSVVMLVTWPEIVLTDSVVQTGETMLRVLHLALPLVVLVLEMLLTGNTRYVFPAPSHLRSMLILS